LAGWYPDRDHYLVADLDPARPIFQGDIFRGVPTAFVDHPAAHEANFAREDPPTPQEAERPLTAEAVRDVTVIRGSLAMVMPHPCDFSEEEKGATHDTRLVAEVREIANSQMSAKNIKGGRVHHCIWVPNPDANDIGQDWFVDLRTTTPVDRRYLNPERRMAALTGPAWIALMRRITVFYTRASLDTGGLVLQEAHQHPDYEHLAGSEADA
jgi:hypothetical protein